MERRVTVPEMILWTGTRIALGAGIGMLVSRGLNNNARKAACGKIQRSRWLERGAASRQIVSRLFATFGAVASRSFFKACPDHGDSFRCLLRIQHPAIST